MPELEYRYSSAIYLTSVLAGGGWSTPRPALPPGKRHFTHCIGDWVGPRAGLDGSEKSRHPRGFDFMTLQTVASHYTGFKET
jgi:hypothetical protein